jgi:hypothetical protein
VAVVPGGKQELSGMRFPYESWSSKWGSDKDICSYACEVGAAGALPEMTSTGTLLCHGEEYTWR